MASIKPKIAPTGVNVNDALQDLTVVHAINLERLKASETAIVMDILDDLGLSVQKQLEKIDPTGVGPTYRARRLARLEKTIKATTALHYKKIKSQSASSLAETAKVGAKATANGVNSSLGVSLGATLPPPVVLRELAGKTLVQGEQVKAYWDEQFAGTRGNFVRQMRMGVAGGEALPALVARVRGTKANNFTDGIMTASKRKAEALVRTSVSAVNNAAAVATIEANGDLFNGVQWLATLDTRTSDICKARSGLTWDENYKPVGHDIAWSPPPAHFNCRSTIIGVLKSWDELANKKLPAVGAETLQKELTKSMTARGLSPLMIEKALYKTQQSMDGFVAGDLNFEDWLKRKPEGFQKDILGEGKWNLWNAGKISFVDLVDQKSMPRSLAEIQALVDAGDTSILKANKAAKAAAKAEAAAAELAAKAAAKIEKQAQGFVDDLLAGVGGVNATKVFKKLDTDGLTATQIKAKVEEGINQINVAANVSNAKKKFKTKGKDAKLSPSEAAAWATVDDDLKAAFIAGLESEAAVYKQLDRLIDKAAKEADDLAILGGGDGYLKTGIKQIIKAELDDSDYVLSELLNSIDDLTFVKNLKGIGGIDSLKAAKKMTKADAEGFVAKFNLASAQMVEANKLPTAIKQAASDMADNYVKQTDNFLFLLLDQNSVASVKAQVGILEKSSVVEYYLKNGPNSADDLSSLVLSKLQKEVTLQNKAFKALAEAEAKAAKAAEALAAKQADEAMDKLAQFAAGGKGFGNYKGVFDKLTKQGKLAGKTAQEQVVLVQAGKDAIDKASDMSTIKKKLKDGKKLSPKLQTVYDDLDPLEQNLLQDAALAKKSKEQLDKEYAAQFNNEATEKAAKRASGGIQFDDLEQIGDQDGSNTGGLFKSKVDGQKFYIKAPDSELAAKVEVLSAKLYQAAGVRVADVNFIKLTGKIGNRDVSGRVGISSRIEEIADVDTSNMGALTGAKEGFAADAWLANWDVIGNGSPKQLNMKKLPDGSAFRIDTGGTLFFRAQGGRKAFTGTDIPELDSIRNNSYNSGDVFGDITEDQLISGVARIVAIEDDDIRRLVNEAMGDDADDLADILIGRKAVLAKTYEKQLKKYNKPAKPKPLEQVSDAEVSYIKESRVNGYVLPTDKGDIEDHEMRVNFLRRDSEDVTTLNMRLRPAAVERIEKTIKLEKATAKVEVISYDDVNDSIVTAIKGIKTRAATGFEQKDFDRAQAAMASITDQKNKLEDLHNLGKITDQDMEDYRRHYNYYASQMSQFRTRYSVGDTVDAGDDLFSEMFSGVAPPKIIVPKKVASKSDEIKWTKKDAVFDQASFDRSFANQKGEFEAMGTTYETEIDGVKVKLFPHIEDQQIAAMEGRIEITAAGHSKEAIAKATNVLEGLGIDTKRATLLDREELYLTRIFYHHSGIKQGKVIRDRSAASVVFFKQEMKRLAGIGSQNERIKELKKLASKAAGVKDVTAKTSYNPIGEYQQFGHGKAMQYNPTMEGKKWEKFFDETVIYQDLEFGGKDQHESFMQIVNGGGQLASTSDRMRRGIAFGGGGSEKADMKSGGASYVFTRFRNKSGYKGRGRKGLYWASKNHTRRLDAVSYDQDYYGSQRFSTARGGLGKKYSELEDWDANIQERAADLNAFIDHASRGNSSNELVLKDGLSLFDDLLCFVVDHHRRDEVIKFMKDNGYKKWPDGRKVEDVIVTLDEAIKLGYIE